MVDVHDKATRSYNMSRIKGTDTKPEMLVRKYLHANGIRYRLHNKTLPGKPDLTLTKYHTVIFVNGCFWHGHNCPLFRLPGTRTEFWQAKIDANRARDTAAEAALLAAGWRVGAVWECALRGRSALPFSEVMDRCAAWLRSAEPQLDIRGLN